MLAASDKTVWITGARGFIGRHLAAWLAHTGHSVVGIGHGPWPAAEAAAWGLRRWLNGDIHASNLQQLLREEGMPHSIFHLAGGSSVGASLASPHEDFARTVGSTAELLEWVRAQARGACLVAVSSAAVYGAGYAGPIGEDQPCRPVSPYGHHKLMMEQLCRSYAQAFQLRLAIVRLFSVYGAWLKKQLLWDLCSRLQAGERELKLGGTGRELRDWTDIRDVVRLLETASNLPFAGATVPVLNGGSGKATSVAEVATLVKNAWPGGAAHIHFSGEVRAGDPFSLVADAAHLRSTGFMWQVAINDGIGEYVRWFLQHGRSSA